MIKENPYRKIMGLLLGESEFSEASDVQPILFGDWKQNEPYAVGSGKYDPSDAVPNEKNAHLTEDNEMVMRKMIELPLQRDGLPRSVRAANGNKQ